ncbi:DUF2975 domain-containing protein [Vibrio sp. Isolate25]|uniref:DUF2975 domain-containing protein n=1 Tax=Vibrio TaxID=662 RepID=UPI001EFC8252|nr:MULTISPECIES: DUF2975 domain-containing protein [Vibrio]MCG9596183.1 DUF2975 domain-containing protein [Vibrio sp. Isolate25]MCG9676785.1 DUF2975 domain-containing protein [Vibrio sp. Isolate24]USD34929.1 DUF2975 domain-containing protein [Vibrio sp. SCSIO 43186]USD47994.1 DUF2975 domain-containing protein [Vibrio sp. SCSIO 43145]USD72053.1 DUF2975 domain-containing protein [Vibrio sp. SCSIO 43139]
MTQQSISTFSRKLLVLFWFSLIFTAVLNTVFWFSATLWNVEWFEASFPVEVELPLSFTRSLIGFLPSMLTTFLTMALLWQLIVLFRLYERGQVFERQNTLCYKKISYLLMATPFVQFIMGILLSFALSYNDGNWSMSFNVNDADITMFVIGLIVRVIAVVMERAAELQKESELTI